MAELLGDEEVLFRSVRPDQMTFVEGVLRISQRAFSDRSLKISFDRAILRTFEEARMGDDQTVVSLETGQIHALNATLYHEEAERIGAFADPLENNPSHALVYACDRNRTHLQLGGSAFKRLQKELAVLAQAVSFPLMP